MSNSFAEVLQELQALKKRSMQAEVRVLISELPDLANPMTAERYLDAESKLGVATERAWTDDEIVQLVLGREKNADNDEGDANDQDDVV